MTAAQGVFRFPAYFRIARIMIASALSADAAARSAESAALLAAFSAFSAAAAARLAAASVASMAALTLAWLALSSAGVQALNAAAAMTTDIPFTTDRNIFVLQFSLGVK